MAERIYVECFMSFLTACCTPSKEGFVPLNMLESAWKTWMGRSGHSNSSLSLARHLGYTHSGANDYLVVTGMSLTKWPAAWGEGLGDADLETLNACLRIFPRQQATHTRVCHVDAAVCGVKEPHSASCKVASEAPTSP